MYSKQALFAAAARCANALRRAAPATFARIRRALRERDSDLCAFRTTPCVARCACAGRESRDLCAGALLRPASRRGDQRFIENLKKCGTSRSRRAMRDALAELAPRLCVLFFVFVFFEVGKRDSSLFEKARGGLEAWISSSKFAFRTRSGICE